MDRLLCRTEQLNSWLELDDYAWNAELTRRITGFGRFGTRLLRRWGRYCFKARDGMQDWERSWRIHPSLLGCAAWKKRREKLDQSET